MIERSEALAMEGDADGSLAMTEAAERFKAQHDELHTQLVTPERTKSVCEVCGVFVNSTDNEQRRQVRRPRLARDAPCDACRLPRCRACGLRSLSATVTCRCSALALARLASALHDRDRSDP
jgi:ATP/maltotriose-dependent transcriptional regulator MalT